MHFFNCPFGDVNGWGGVGGKWCMLYLRNAKLNKIKLPVFLQWDLLKILFSKLNYDSPGIGGSNVRCFHT